MFAVSEALSAVAKTTSPLTRSVHLINLCLPFSANTNLSGAMVSVYGVADHDLVPVHYRFVVMSSVPLSLAEDQWRSAVRIADGRAARITGLPRRRAAMPIAES